MREGYEQICWKSQKEGGRRANVVNEIISLWQDEIWMTEWEHGGGDLTDNHLKELFRGKSSFSSEFLCTLSTSNAIITRWISRGVHVNGFKPKTYKGVIPLHPTDFVDKVARITLVKSELDCPMWRAVWKFMSTYISLNLVFCSNSAEWISWSLHSRIGDSFGCRFLEPSSHNSWISTHFHAQWRWNLTYIALIAITNCIPST